MATKKSTKRVDYFKYDPVVNRKDTFNIDKALNENWDKTADEFERQEEQITDCLGEIEKVKQEVDNLDVSSDVRKVINERVNSELSKPLNTIITEVKTTITDFITVAKNTILERITEINGTIIANITAKSTEINNNTNNARDNIKSHITSTIESKSNKIYTISNNKKDTILSIETASSPTAYVLLGKFVPKYNGMIRIRIRHKRSGYSGSLYIASLGKNKIYSDANMPYSGTIADLFYTIHNAARGTNIPQKHLQNAANSMLELSNSTTAGTYFDVYYSILVNQGEELLLFAASSNDTHYINLIELYYDVMEV